MKRKMLICLMLILAVSAFAVKVSPVRYDISVARGTSKEFTLNVFGSKGLQTQDLMIYPSDLSMDRRGALSFDLTNSRNSAVKWIKLERSKLSLLEEQSRDIKFKVSIPSNVIPGEYYAVIMVEPEKFVNVKDKKQPVTLKLKTRVAIVVILDVPGRVYEKKGEITGLAVVPPTEKYVKLSSSFKNTGNIHLDVTASGVIRSADGKINFGKFELRALASSKSEAFIFPNGTRDFEGVLKRQLPEGDYLADVSYNYGYNFKKANKTIKFSIKRKGVINEKNAEFLGFERKEMKLSLPVGSTRIQVIKVTNTDYRPISVVTESSDWIKINPKTFNLKPGEVKNVQAIISVSEYKEAIKKANIIFRPDRGKSSVIAVSIYKPGTPNLKELLKITEAPQTNTENEPVAGGAAGKKLEQQSSTSNEQPQVSKDSVTAKNDSDVSVEKANVKPNPVKEVKTNNAFSKLFAGNNVIFGGLGLIGIAIIFLLILLLRKNKKNGNDAKN